MRKAPHPIIPRPSSNIVVGSDKGWLRNVCDSEIAVVALTLKSKTEAKPIAVSI